jgi:chromate transporter
MQAAVAAVIIDVTLTMCWALIKEKNMLPIIVMICAFSAAYFLKINVIYIILSCGLLGMVSVTKKVN